MMITPKRNPHSIKPRSCQISENCDPNLLNSTPVRRPIKSPSLHSAKKPKKSAPKTPASIKSPPPPTSTKKSSKKKAMKDPNLKKDAAVLDSVVPCEANDRDLDLEGSSKVRKMKSLMLEDAMSSIPEPGAGRVMHLVKAFERLLSIPKDREGENGEGKKGRVMNWALPGLQRAPRAEETDNSSPSLFSSLLEFERESCEQQQSSVDSNGGRLSWGSSSSECDKRSGSKSTCSSGRSWNKKLKATSQQGFKLRTEQRGRFKEEHFLEKVKEMFLEEEKQRIPIAQGLPWTTEHPECLAKPFVKESTEPADLVLHSDVRAAERAEFDHHFAERMSFIEQIKLERERLQKMEEEEEIRRFRKELVPKAQPMPYFDRPFVPKRSRKPRTIPKEPTLLIRQTKTREKRKSAYAQQTGDLTCPSGRRLQDLLERVEDDAVSPR